MAIRDEEGIMVFLKAYLPQRSFNCSDIANDHRDDCDESSYLSRSKDNSDGCSRSSSWRISLMNAASAFLKADLSIGQSSG